MLQIKGLLKVKLEEVQVTEKFRKREFVLEDNASQYPQLISFQLTQDRCSMIDTFNVGDEINVNFNLRGREWTDPKTNTVKYFNSIEAWKIELITKGQGQAPQQQNTSNTNTNPPQQNIQNNPGTFSSSSDDQDDLPF